MKYFLLLQNFRLSIRGVMRENGVHDLCESYAVDLI